MILKNFYTKKSGDGTILTMILVFVLITMTVLIGEYFRIHMLGQDIEYQIQRAVNCSVEYAMGDSYRQDKIINLNVAEAKKQFYKYIKADTGLDNEYKKFMDGKVKYRLYFTKADGTSNPAVFTVSGYAEAESLFSFLPGKIKLPFKISSTNYRLD